MVWVKSWVFADREFFETLENEGSPHMTFGPPFSAPELTRFGGG